MRKLTYSKKIIGMLFMIFICAAGLLAQETLTFRVEVNNPDDAERTGEPVVIKLHEPDPGFRVRSAVVRDGTVEIASQLDDLTGDGKPDELAFTVNIPQKLVKEETQDKVNYLYILQAPEKNYFNYHITFTSLKETFGYPTKEEWFAHVQEWKKRVSTPCLVTVYR
ncbi:MAG: DUF4861 domain-containing protein [Tannerellaceae bacterium]|nr:DUF4861 domain-containing protein [Tannerellaceae bacterium]